MLYEFLAIWMWCCARFDIVFGCFCIMFACFYIVRGPLYGGRLRKLVVFFGKVLVSLELGVVFLDSRFLDEV